MPGALQGIHFTIRTFGCQMNENDSEHMAGLLVREGAVPAASALDSDIILVNTCAVREKSEEKLYSYIGRLAALKKARPRIIAVTGCVAQLHRDALLRRIPIVDLVVGPDNYLDLPVLLARSLGRRQVQAEWRGEWHEFGPAEILRDDPTTAYVPIMEGCDNFCAYCVVPFTRGRIKCRPRTSVLAEIRHVAGAGYLEIQLLGQNVNAYRDPETGDGFAALLEEVSRDGGIEWIRFLTSHPKDLTPEIARVMAGRPNICRQIHLPLQSGSTAVLTRMNRGYSREDYLRKIDLLKSLMPGISLSTDIIVGFPGETDADFRETLKAVDEIGYSNIFSFCYSPRPRTAAARIPDDVPDEVKKGRLIELQDLQKRVQMADNQACVGRGLKVLCLGRSKRGGLYSGRSEGSLVVNFSAAGDVRGRFVEVLVTGAGPYSLVGEMKE
jgi:tRNA-2-methylthio-N6-dimethylallyladenosine synthase